MAGRKSDFTLPKFDDIFSTQEMRDDEKLAKIRDIPLELMGERICTIPASIAFGHPNADLLGIIPKQCQQLKKSCGIYPV